jgi:spore coat polysaccharide biosynthesis predicted glycosyltransferase SpsG
MIEHTGLKATSRAKQVKGASREYILCFNAEQQQGMAKLVKSCEICNRAPSSPLLEHTKRLHLPAKAAVGQL